MIECFSRIVRSLRRWQAAKTLNARDVRVLELKGWEKGIKGSPCSGADRRSFFCSCSVAIGLPATISLAECTALESLTLQFPVHYSTAVPWVPALLATLDSPSIRRVALEVRLLGSVDALQWAELNKVLGAPAFRSLQAIAVDVNLWPGVHKDMAEVEGIVRTRLRPFEEKGMVRFGRA